MAQMLSRYLGDVIWPRHRGMWECRRGIIRVSKTEEKIGDSRSTRRCHEGAWMLACRSISILCFHLPSLDPCYSIRRPRGNSIIISTNFETNFSKNLSNLDDDLTIFPRQMDRYRYRSHINETFQLPRTRNEGKIHFLQKSNCEKKSVLSWILLSSSSCPRHRQGKTKVEEERLIGNTTRR